MMRTHLGAAHINGLTHILIIEDPPRRFLKDGAGAPPRGGRLRRSLTKRRGGAGGLAWGLRRGVVGGAGARASGQALVTARATSVYAA